jgi:hypothetical protein
MAVSFPAASDPGAGQRRTIGHGAGADGTCWMPTTDVSAGSVGVTLHRWGRWLVVAGSLAMAPALVGCDAPRLTLRQMCIQECERTGRTFEAIERCRMGCREAYEQSSTSFRSIRPRLQVSHPAPALASVGPACHSRRST